MCILFINILYFDISYATETQIQIDEFLSTIQQYANDIIPELKEKNVLEKVIGGENVVKENFINRVLNLFLKEFKIAISIIIKILVTTMFCGLLKNIGPENDSGVKEIAFYIAYLVIVGLIISSYINIADLCKETITKLTEFINLLVPLVLGLMVANGTIVSAGMMQPILLMMSSFINTIINSFMLPLIFISLVINIVSNISENIKISKLPEMIQKYSINFLKCSLAVFIAVLSIEGTLSANVDGFTAKTTKAIVSTTIPVVGKALSDAADSVIGAASITKNAIGVIGIIVVVAVVIQPITKIFSLMLIFNISSALIEPVADKRISNCMTVTGDAIKNLFALVSTVSIIFILAISLMIKISNFSIMY